MNEPPSHQIEPIGWLTSPFTEKFGTPRQSGEVKHAKGNVFFYPKYQLEEAFRELEQFSHLWLIFQFHQHATKPWKPLVRPPRLGGNTRVGVFASRSPFRPNSLGLSVVKLDAISTHPEHKIVLQVSGIDLIDHTPIYDIKPYLTHSDSLPEANSGYSPVTIQTKEVLWQCDYTGEQKALIEETLSLDPRPGYKTEEGEAFGCTVGAENITFRVIAQKVEILSVTS